MAKQVRKVKRKSNKYTHNPAKDRLLHATLVELKGMSVKDIAAKTGVSEGTIYNWRALKYCPRSSTFHLVLIALGKTIKIVDEGK